MFNFRKSKRPSKQFLWQIICNYLLKRKYSSCIDVASSNFILYKYIKSKTYAALDIDSDAINFLQKNFSNIKTFHTSIEDFKTSLKWELVLCLQTIGINSHYQNSNTLDNIDKLILLTQSKGELIFNIGPESINYKNKIEEKLKNQFYNINKIEYGAFSSNRNIFISIFLAYLMYYIPILRKINKNYCLFICKNKNE